MNPTTASAQPGTAPERRRTLLLVTSAQEQATAFREALTVGGYTVLWLADSLSALIAVEDAPPALVILDWTMPFIPGHIFVEAVRTGLPQPPPVVVLLDGSTATAAEEVLAAGAQACLRMPVAPAILVQLVGELLVSSSA